MDPMSAIAADNHVPRRRSPLPPLRSMALDAAHLVLGLPAGIVTFTLIVTGLATGAGLAITLVGVPILLATLVVARAVAEGERLRASMVLGERIRGRERPLDGSLWERARTLSTDGATWRDVLWGLLALPIGTLGFALAVAAWTTALGLVSSPIWLWAVPEDGDPAILDDAGAGYSVLRVVIGLVLIPVAAWGCRAAAEGSARAARSLLG
jgi:hypothetical protein